MTDQRPRWLHIDEIGTLSGRAHEFDKGARALVGVLLSRDAVAIFDESLPRLLAETLPHVPAPYHASHVGRPMCHAAWAEEAIRYEDEGNVPTVALKAAKWFRETLPEQWCSVCEHYFYHRSYDADAWKALFQALKSDREGLADALKSYAWSAEAELRNAVSVAAQEAAAIGAPVITFVAAAPERSDAWPTLFEFCYQDYLYALCTRLIDALREAEPDGSLTLLVPQSLGLEPGNGHWRLLQIPEVREVTLMATPTLPGGQSPHRIHISEVRKGWAGRPADWTADIVARQLTWQLKRGRSLDRIRKRLVPLGVALGFDDGLPTISALGSLFDQLEACRAHKREGTQSTPIPANVGWPTEQARLWAGVVR